MQGRQLQGSDPALKIEDKRVRWVFSTPALEKAYRSLLHGQTVGGGLRNLPIGLVLTLGLGVLFYLLLLSDDEDAYLLRVAFSAAGIALGLIAVLVTFARRVFADREAVLSWLLCVLLTVSCGLWAAATCVYNDRLGTATSAGGFLAGIVVLHTLCRPLLQPCLVVASTASTLVFLIVSFFARPGGEPALRWLLEALLCVVASVLLSWNSHQMDSLRRSAFVSQLNVSLGLKEEEKLRKEALSLRDEVYLMTLERFGSIDPDSANLDLKAPVEKAIGILQRLEKDAALSNAQFLDIKKVITLLGSSNIFRPQVDEELRAKSGQLGQDTERWIVSLLQNQAQEQGQEQAGASAEHGASAEAAGDEKAAGAALVRQPVDEEERRFHQMISSTDDWDWDVFEIARLTKGRPLYFIGMALFQKYNLIQRLRLPVDKLRNFLTAIESGYLELPYHNSTHAADVTRSSHFFLATGKLKACMSDIEILSCLLASAVHDYDHPGVGNSYHIQSRHEKAILYNDQSVLENHHVAQAYFVLMKPENNFLSHLPRAQYDEIRKIVIETVLATDLSRHFDILTQFNAALHSQQIDRTQAKSRQMLIKMVVKASDVAHAAKELSLHKNWSLRVIEEFYRQGDMERKQNLQISPFMDRHKPNVPKAQSGFIDFLVKPMFDAFVGYLIANGADEGAAVCLRRLQSNREYWKEQGELHTDAAPQPAATATATGSNNTGPSPSSPATAAAAVALAAPRAAPAATAVTAAPPIVPSNASVVPVVAEAPTVVTIAAVAPAAAISSPGTTPIAPAAAASSGTTSPPAS